MRQVCLRCKKRKKSNKIKNMLKIKVRWDKSAWDVERPACSRLLALDGKYFIIKQNVTVQCSYAYFYSSNSSKDYICLLTLVGSGWKIFYHKTKCDCSVFICIFLFIQFIKGLYLLTHACWLWMDGGFKYSNILWLFTFIFISLSSDGWRVQIFNEDQNVTVHIHIHFFIIGWREGSNIQWRQIVKQIHIHICLQQ